MNTPSTTLGAMMAPVGALMALASQFASLPGGQIRLSDIYPDRIDLSLHDDLAAFETWRQALGIDPDTVTCGTQGNGRTRVLKAACDYAGARLHLTGYSDLPEQDGGAA